MFDNYRVIDLTLTLDESLPCTWPGHMPFQKKNWTWYQKVEYLGETIRDSRCGPYFTEWLALDEHVGTHFDAPSHFIPQPNSGMPNAGPAGAITGEKIDLSKMMGEAVVIDLTFLCGEGVNGESPYILRPHIQQWEEKYGEIHKGEIVLFYTGWDKYYVSGKGGKAYSYNALVEKTGFGWPAPDVDTIEYLYNKGVTCIGTDGASMGSAQNGAPVHIFGLSKELIYIEGLCQLNQLPARGSYFIFLPIKVAMSSGCPGRAIALVRK
ncbi:kynurenine formamidase [Moorella thermoacetica]|uniref:Kynurenine formamidase n=1 Tax=Neomoorella thermoacetica TaxID=1525 RepID=A0A1J5JK25_NEOTH|nr:cyclase family protein [Moorella thermoacetica]OIQ09874.1 kynurenine formamidase [Moorella thermoacetica]